MCIRRTQSPSVKIFYLIASSLQLAGLVMLLLWQPVIVSCLPLPTTFFCCVLQLATLPPYLPHYAWPNLGSCTSFYRLTSPHATTSEVPHWFVHFTHYLLVSIRHITTSCQFVNTSLFHLRVAQFDLVRVVGLHYLHLHLFSSRLQCCFNILGLTIQLCLAIHQPHFVSYQLSSVSHRFHNKLILYHLEEQI